MNYIFDYKKAACCMLVTLALLLASCNDDDDNGVSGFNIDQTEVQFGEDGGSIELAISTNESWTAISQNNDWCTVSPASGMGSSKCIITAKTSELYDSRTVIVIFETETGKEKEIVVNQFGYAPTIQVTEDKLTVPSYAAPDEAYIDVEAIANVPFKVEMPEAVEWLTLEGNDSYKPITTQPQKQKFRFKFKTNSDFELRDAQVKFVEIESAKTKAGGSSDLIEKSITITQEAAPKIIPSREGDSLAILAIARVLNAGVYWPTSRPITHWDNVVVDERTYMYNDGVNTPYERTELRVISVGYSMVNTKESIPYQVKFLDQLETLAVTGNSNAYLKKIELGTEVTQLKKLKSLSLMGYGISKLPEEIKNMDALEELDLSGNCFLKIPEEIRPLNSKKQPLKYLDLRGNRITSSVVNLQTDIPSGLTLETIGLVGELPTWLFTMDNLEYLYLSYNYLYGSIPAMTGYNDVMPNLRMLALNLNRFTGDLPDWILQHKRLACWNPFILLFNQEGYDNEGKLAGFKNEPKKISDLVHPDCPDDIDEAELEIALRLPELTPKEIENVPLHGHWRYYRMLNKDWNHYIKW